MNYFFVQLSAHKYIVVQDAGTFSIPSGIPLKESAHAGNIVFGPAKYADALNFFVTNTKRDDPRLLVNILGQEEDAQ